MYVKRELEKKVKKYLDTKEIIAIVGPRQCGKTTMTRQILKDLPDVNIISFDDAKVRQLFEEDIDSFIEVNVKGYKYLFIDEVQYSKDSGKQLKYIYDTQQIKVILSGSSAPELSIQSLKYLVGRIFVFTLYPFSFKEFLSYKDKRLYPLYEKKKYDKIIIDSLMKYIKEYVIYGGYPRVVLSKTSEEKEIVLKNIYNIYLLKEIREILELSDNNKLMLLMKSLSLQIGNMINYNELSNITGFSYEQIKKYLLILEETYICNRCYTFYKNRRTELVKTPKIYFIDYGFRNVCIDNFNKIRSDQGAIYENLVYTESMKKDIILKYWRTKSGAEVDFIDGEIPIEIKTIPKITRSLLSYISKYKPEEAYIISLDEKKSVVKERCKINFVPFSKFI